jgi:uncharacterized protein YhdP
VASIPDLHEPVLTVGGGVVAPLSSFVRFAEDGPLANRLAGFFAGAQASGAARLTLQTVIPLYGDAPEQVRGAISLNGNAVEQPRFALALDELRGTVGFSEAGVEFDALRARYDGREVVGSGTAANDASGQRITRIEVRGPARVSQVLRRYGVPWYRYFSGESDVVVRIDIAPPRDGRVGTVELRADSDLRGTELLLPAPLSKPAAQARETRFEMRLSGPAAGERLRIRQPRHLAADVQLARGGSALRRADIRLGAVPNQVFSGDGVHLFGVADKLDPLGWFEAVGLFGQAEQAADGAALAESLAAAASASPAKPALPLSIDLVTDQLNLGDVVLHDVVLHVEGDRGARRGEIGSRELVGRFQQPLIATERRALVIALERLNVDALFAADGAGDGVGAPVQSVDSAQRWLPRWVPPLSLDIGELRWQKRVFHKVRLRTEPASGGLRVREIGFNNGSLVVTGSGSWRYSPRGGVDWARGTPSGQPVHRSDLSLNLSADNLGAGLRRLGVGDAIDEGRAQASVDLLWYDALYAPDLRSLAGSAQFDIRDGRILAVDPGAGRIFGLFALQALPRRLTLDFSDMMRSGLEFDRIDGRLAMAGGQANTELLRLDGPIGVIDVLGRTDYLRRRYEQRITVLPRVGSALPVIGLLTGGIGTGLSVLLADGLLKGMGINIDELGRREYRLRGSWDQPVVEEVALDRGSESGGER